MRVALYRVVDYKLDYLVVGHVRQLNRPRAPSPRHYCNVEFDDLASQGHSRVNLRAGKGGCWVAEAVRLWRSGGAHGLIYCTWGGTQKCGVDPKNAGYWAQNCGEKLKIGVTLAWRWRDANFCHWQQVSLEVSLERHKDGCYDYWFYGVSSL